MTMPSRPTECQRPRPIWAARHVERVAVAGPRPRPRPRARARARALRLARPQDQIRLEIVGPQGLERPDQIRSEIAGAHGLERTRRKAVYEHVHVARARFTSTGTVSARAGPASTGSCAARRSRFFPSARACGARAPRRSL